MEGVFLQKEINDLGGKQRQKHAHTDEHKEYEMFAHCSCLIIPRKATNNGNIVSTKKSVANRKLFSVGHCPSPV